MRFGISIIVGAVVLLVGCRENAQQTKLQYMPDMADAPTVKAQEDFLPPPEGSIAMTDILYPESAQEAEAQLVMPPRIPLEKDVIAQGEKLWNTYCIVCHGPNAKGDGYVTDLFPRPPDLTLDLYKQKGDGHFYYIITFGSAIMPSYGYAISPDERWQIVHYLRTLQKAAVP